MTIQVYRVYPIDTVLDPEVAHQFSIVATEKGADYAVPDNPEITDFDGFDQDRIQEALSMEESAPTTPLDWALVASINMSMLDVKPVDVEYDSVEDAIAEESALAEDAWYMRKADEE